MIAALRSLIYASGFGLFWYYLILWARPLDHRIPITIAAWLKLPGIILAVGGFIIAMSCAAVFSFIGHGTPAPFDPPREFVAVGPYRYVRNPMYLGALGVIIGAGLAMQSVSALVVAIGFAIFVNLFLFVYEEPSLEKRFGQSYVSYKKKVNRWIPRLP